MRKFNNFSIASAVFVQPENCVQTCCARTAYRQLNPITDLLVLRLEHSENIARLFRTTAEAERIHAEGHLGALDGIGSTIENLKAAIGGETYEYTEMYPPMLEQAEAENHKAKRMFKYAVKAEAVHAKLYKLALEAAERGEDLSESEFYLCPVCGNIEFGKPEEKCPVCGLPADKYIQVS